MSPHRYRPVFLRYLKARLWNLAQPSFWGTLIFLFVVGLLIKQYWTNSNFVFRPRTQNSENQNPENTQPLESFLSEEDRAIAADIDNLPVLFYESRQQDLSTRVNKLKKKASSENLVKQQNILPNQSRSNYLVTKEQKIPSPKIENPFLQQANKLLELNNFGSGQQFVQNNPANATYSGSSITTSFNSGALNFTSVNAVQNPTATNVLQTALDQLEGKNQQQQQTLSQSSLQNKSLQNNIPLPTVPSYQSPNSQSNINNTGLPVTASTPISPNGRLQSSYVNQRLPQRFINNYNRVNIQTNMQNNIRNLPPNSYNTYVSAPQPVNVNPTRQLNAPVSSGVTNNITSNNSKFHSLQTPRQTVITPNNSVVPNNYNPNLQPYYQQPTTVTNYNYSTPGQVPQKINGYSYP